MLSRGIKESDVLIGMHVGVGLKLREYRRWSQKKFAAVGDALSERYHAKIVLTGSKDEAALTEEVVSLMKCKAVSLAGALTIKQTASLAKRCRLFISNDSGVAHVAAAVKTPLIVLFGPTNKSKTSPLGSHVIVLDKKGNLNPKNPDQDIMNKYLYSMDWIKVEEVLDTAHKFLNK